jgi:hypothetical protein
MIEHTIIAEYQFLRDEESLRAFFDAFKNRTLPKPEWKHAAHVCVAACTLIETPNDAVALLRERIIRYNESVGTANTPDAGYHETLTVFWAETIRKLLHSLEPNTPFVDAVRSAVVEFAPKRDMFVAYYSFDVVKSRAARAQWVPPDVIEI